MVTALPLPAFLSSMVALTTLRLRSSVAAALSDARLSLSVTRAGSIDVSAS